MKKLFIIANWKSNKTIEETEEWLHDFSDGFNKANIKSEDKKTIIAPPFTSLEHARYCSRNLKLSLEFAAQDVSTFNEGAYTGEVSAKQIKELADYVIVGHSERRQNLGEDEDVVHKKLEQVFKYELIPILCVSNFDQVQSSKFKVQSYSSKFKVNNRVLIAYEPLFAIGSGKPDTPESADEMGKKIKETLGEIPVLYGGSVTSENVASFTRMPHIDGVLVGGASLDPLEFLEIIKNA